MKWVFASVLSLGVAVGAATAADEPIKRPERPAKSYRIGVLEPNMAIPHFVAQAYGFADEAENSVPKSSCTTLESTRTSPDRSRRWKI